MKLLADTPLPASVTTLSTPEMTLERWEGGQAADGEFVRRAAEAGYAAVVLLGRESLSRPDLWKSAAESSVALLVVSVKDPIRAHDALAQHISRLPAEIGPGRAIVASSQELTVLSLADLTSDSSEEAPETSSDSE